MQLNKMEKKMEIYKENKPLKKEIEKLKNKLLLKAKEKGLYENFGQKEINKLKEKYIDISSYSDEINQRRDLIHEFNDFCANCSDIDLK